MAMWRNNLCARANIVFALLIVAFQVAIQAQEHPYPVTYKYHCGGKARNSVPRAMGFAQDSRTLAIWYMSNLILIDACTGQEIRRVRTSEKLLFASPYNFVEYDKSGKHCCIATVHSGGFDLQFFDVDRGRGSEPVEQRYSDQRTWTLSTWYASNTYHLPLRQWLAFQRVNVDSEATFEALFPKLDEYPQARTRFHVSFDGNEYLQKTEQIFSSMGGERAIRAARNAGRYAGDGMQVALSLNQKTLLTQFIGDGLEGAQVSYRFRFYDVESKERVGEIRIPTGIYSRRRGSRGFAFSPDFRKLARSMPGGHVIVHDLSRLVERTVDASAPVVILADYGTANK